MIIILLGLRGNIGSRHISDLYRSIAMGHWLLIELDLKITSIMHMLMQLAANLLFDSLSENIFSGKSVNERNAALLLLVCV
ncbi:hypothetical protein ACJX0J_032233, partial [Zea mays]